VGEEDEKRCHFREWLVVLFTLRRIGKRPSIESRNQIKRGTNIYIYIYIEELNTAPFSGGVFQVKRHGGTSGKETKGATRPTDRRLDQVLTGGPDRGGYEGQSKESVVAGWWSMLFCWHCDRMKVDTRATSTPLPSSVPYRWHSLQVLHPSNPGSHSFITQRTTHLMSKSMPCLHS
jgi:hypothetical protein